MRSILARLSTLERAPRRDNITFTFADGSKRTVTAGDAVLMAQTAHDVVDVTDNGSGGNGMLAALIAALFKE